MNGLIVTLTGERPDAEWPTALADWIRHNDDVLLKVYIVILFIYYWDEELRFMYKNNQGHLTVFCIVFVWLRGPPSPVRIMTQVPWFMYQNRLGPSGGIYYPNFVPCFVVLYLNDLCMLWGGRGLRSGLFIFESKYTYMGVFYTHFVPLISILAPKIIEEWNNQL